MKVEYNLNDDCIMKKPHACGTNLWTITRVGADVKIKCKHFSHTGFCIEWEALFAKTSHCE